MGATLKQFENLYLLHNKKTIFKTENVGC